MVGLGDRGRLLHENGQQGSRIWEDRGEVDYHSKEVLCDM